VLLFVFAERAESGIGKSRLLPLYLGVDRAADTDAHSQQLKIVGAGVLYSVLCFLICAMRNKDYIFNQ
jgi:hypothetical protein